MVSGLKPVLSISSLSSMIVQVKVVLIRTVGDSDCRFDNLCGIHLQNQSNCVWLVNGTYVSGDLTCSRRSDSGERCEE